MWCSFYYDFSYFEVGGVYLVPLRFLNEWYLVDYKKIFRYLFLIVEKLYGIQTLCVMSDNQ